MGGVIEYSIHCVMWLMRWADKSTSLVHMGEALNLDVEERVASGIVCQIYIKNFLWAIGLLALAR